MLFIFYAEKCQQNEGKNLEKCMRTPAVNPMGQGNAREHL